MTDIMVSTKLLNKLTEFLDKHAIPYTLGDATLDRILLISLKLSKKDFKFVLVIKPDNFTFIQPKNTSESDTWKFANWHPKFATDETKEFYKII